MSDGSDQFARKLGRRLSSALVNVWTHGLLGLASTALRLQANPSVRTAWQAASTQLLLATLSSHGENILIQHPITVAGASAVTIGNDVSIAAYVHIWGHGGVSIGHRVMIGAHTSITSLTHDYNEDVMRFTVVSRPVIIGDDVWIGSNCVVLPGLSIGDGSVLGAGSVVTKDVEPFSIVSGVPARVIGSRRLAAGPVTDG